MKNICLLNFIMQICTLNFRNWQGNGNCNCEQWLLYQCSAKITFDWRIRLVFRFSIFLDDEDNSSSSLKPVIVVVVVVVVVVVLFPVIFWISLTNTNVFSYLNIFSQIAFSSILWSAVALETTFYCHCFCSFHLAFKDSL